MHEPSNLGGGAREGWSCSTGGSPDKHPSITSVTAVGLLRCHSGGPSLQTSSSRQSHKMTTRLDLDLLRHPDGYYHQSPSGVAGSPTSESGGLAHLDGSAGAVVSFRGTAPHRSPTRQPVTVARHRRNLHVARRLKSAMRLICPHIHDALASKSGSGDTWGQSPSAVEGLASTRPHTRPNPPSHSPFLTRDLRRFIDNLLAASVTTTGTGVGSFLRSDRMPPSMDGRTHEEKSVQR